MCGRFTFEHEWSAFFDLYNLPWVSERGRNLAARFNIAPTQHVLVVHNDAEGRRRRLFHDGPPSAPIPHP